MEQAVGNFSANYFSFNTPSGGKSYSGYDFMPHEEPMKVGADNAFENYLASMVGK